MRKMVVNIGLVLFVAAFLLTACGGGEAKGPAVGDAARGEKLYASATLGKNSAEGCTSCHNQDAAAGLDDKAPYTTGTATRSATRVAGLSAEEYIRESILNPNAYVVENYKADDMYQKWGEDLSEQELADLIAYLLTQK